MPSLTPLRRPLREALLGSNHGDTLAEAARDCLMKDLVTKADMDAALDRQTVRLAVIIGVLVAASFIILIA